MKFNVVLISLGFCVVAHGLVADVPGVNGPIPVVPFSEGMKKHPSDFVHPGLWHTTDQLETIRSAVINGSEPWASTYQKFAADKYSQPNYTMQGPYPVISRGGKSNYTSFQQDARAAYQNAIMWYITKNQTHWQRATTILDGWGSNLTNIIGTDRSLLIGIDGETFVNAAEIMRWTGNWTEAGAAWQGGSGFSVQLYWLFARQSVVIGQSNYGIASIKALLAFAVYLDDVSMYNYALNAYKYDLCAGIESTIDPSAGQSSESGRDQAHVFVGLGWMGLGSRTVAAQGYDLWKYAGNLIFKGAEYTAKYNMNQTVPYDPKFYRCEAVLVNGPWKEISAINRGITAKTKAIWDLFYYEARAHNYQNTWITKAKQYVDSLGGEVSVNDNEMPSWGDLLWARNN